MFHLNPQTGNPNRCTAKEGNCPFGADAPHFETKDDARASYEHAQIKEGYLEVMRKTRVKDGFRVVQSEEETPKAERPYESFIKATAEVFAEPFKKPEPPRERKYYKSLEESVVSATASALRPPPGYFD